MDRRGARAPYAHLVRYPNDVLAADNRPKRPVSTPVVAERGLVVEDPTTGFCGAVQRCENGLVVLEDRRGKKRSFRLGPGFLLEGKPVDLRAPSLPPSAPTRSRSGSVAATGAERAKVAAGGRIFVEGRHDAELVEKIWGDDLRHVGVVVEFLGGVDELVEVVTEFAPAPERRLGVLVDHLVPGSKESRIADAVTRGPSGAHVLVLGHRFIDIWEAVKPERLGLRQWPVIPKGTEWKVGVCAALGWPHADQADIAAAWQRILGRVRDWNDLDRELLTTVERLIDFVMPE
jgi:Protein of unknown function (DUF3097)